MKNEIVIHMYNELAMPSKNGKNVKYSIITLIKNVNRPSNERIGNPAIFFFTISGALSKICFPRAVNGKTIAAIPTINQAKNHPIIE